MEATVLFDGVCNLCSASVQFVLKHDRRGYFRFASLQSDAGRQLLAQHGLSPDLTSIVLIENGRALRESDAVLHIARQLDAPYRWLWAGRHVPRPVRDGLYRFVARRRYRFFGQAASCWLPREEWRPRFLE